MRTRPKDLIVPVRDRRRGKRYLTTKNVSVATVTALVLFVAVSTWSELRDPGPNHYGRILEHELQARVEQRPVEVVREAGEPVPDQTAADPMLLAPMARERWLQDGGMEPQPVTPVATPVIHAAAAGESRVAIVGGTDGVAIVQQSRRRPELSGGFGRQ